MDMSTLFESVHLFSRYRGNWWYPLDITSIEIDGTPLVLGIYARDFWDILRQAALTVYVLARLCWASTGTGGGGEQRCWFLIFICLRPQCLQFTNNTYTIRPHIHQNMGPVLEKPCSPSSLITKHCACASRITRPDSPMRHIDTDRFLHDLAHISH